MAMKETQRSGWRKRLAGIGAGLVVAAASVVAFAAPAQAAPSGCELGNTCAYSGYNYTQDWFYSTLQFGYCVDDFSNYGVNDTTSSVFNNGRSLDSWLYQDWYAYGASKRVYRGQGITNLGSFNDLATSGYFQGYEAQRKTWRCE